MRNAKRGRGSRRGVYVCAVAALGFALSGCGGGGNSSSAATAAQSSTPMSSATAQSSTSSQSSAPAPSASANSGAPAASSGSVSGGGTPSTASIANVTINWTPPTENTDGTSLTNLSGYNIHYGTASHNYTQTISVTNPGLASYVVENLTAGTYYFAVAAVNSAGTESPLSSEVSTKVN